MRNQQLDLQPATSDELKSYQQQKLQLQDVSPEDLRQKRIQEVQQMMGPDEFQRAMAAGLAQAGRGLYGLVQPALAKIPEVGQYIKPMPDITGKLLSPSEQQDVLAKAGQFVGGALPYAIAGPEEAAIKGITGLGRAGEALKALEPEAGMLGKAALKAGRAVTSAIPSALTYGSLSGALTPTDREEAAITGAALGPLGEAAPMVGGVLKKGYNAMKREVTENLLSPAVKDNLSKMFSIANHFNNSDAYKDVVDNYRGKFGYFDKNQGKHIPGSINKAYDAADALSSEWDDSGNFDPNIYKKGLKNAQSKLLDRFSDDEDIKKINEIIGAELNKTSYKMSPAGARIDPQINTLSAAMQARKKLSSDYGNLLTRSQTLKPGNEAAQAANRAAHDALIDSIQKNVSNGPNTVLSDKFLDRYNEANKLYADNKNMFERTVVGKGGGTVPTIFHNIYSNPHVSADGSLFVKDIFPLKGEDVGKLDQLKGMLGDEEKARNLAISNVFQKSLDGDKINPSKASKIYHDLSGKQQKWLFPDEKDRVKFEILKRTQDPTTIPSGLKKLALMPFGVPYHIADILSRALQGGGSTHLADGFKQNILNKEIQKALFVGAPKPLPESMLLPKGIRRGFITSAQQEPDQGGQ